VGAKEVVRKYGFAQNRRLTFLKGLPRAQGRRPLAHPRCYLREGMCEALKRLAEHAKQLHSHDHFLTMLLQMAPVRRVDTLTFRWPSLEVDARSSYALSEESDAAILFRYSSGQL
jgi:hypothetical protein